MVKIKKICEQCGKEFELFPSQIKQGKGKFCSRKCSQEARKNKEKRVCEQCGKEFEVLPSTIKHGGGIFCSRKCRRESMRTKVKRVCKQCGKEFLKNLSEIKRGGGKFCSHKCHGEWVSEHKKGEKHPNWKGGLVNRICEECGKEFPADACVVKIGKGRFCSHQCANDAQKGENHPSWKGGLVKRICEECGKEFEAKPSQIKQGKGRFCSHKCFGEWQSKHIRGENSPGWKGGVSFEPYCEKFDEPFREYIREKFGRVCFLCPKTEAENGRKLSVHHVNYDKDCLCDDNLTCQFVPLCMSCHGKVNANRKKWEAKINNMLHNSLKGWYI